MNRECFNTKAQRRHEGHEAGLSFVPFVSPLCLCVKAFPVPLLIGVLLMTLSGTPPPSSKQASLTVTAEARANAVRNAARFPWAAADRDAAMRAAAPWLALSDEALWELVPGQELPRSIHVYKVYGTNQ